MGWPQGDRLWDTMVLRPVRADPGCVKRVIEADSSAGPLFNPEGDHLWDSLWVTSYGTRKRCDLSVMVTAA